MMWLLTMTRISSRISVAVVAVIGTFGAKASRAGLAPRVGKKAKMSARKIRMVNMGSAQSFFLGAGVVSAFLTGAFVFLDPAAAFGAVLTGTSTFVTLVLDSP